MVTHAFSFGLWRSASADVKSLTSASADVGKVTSLTSLTKITDPSPYPRGIFIIDDLTAVLPPPTPKKGPFDLSKRQENFM